MAGLSTVSKSHVLEKQEKKVRDASGLSVDRSTFHKSLCRNGLSGRQAFKEGKQGEKLCQITQELKIRSNRSHGEMKFYISGSDCCQLVLRRSEERYNSEYLQPFVIHSAGSFQPVGLDILATAWFFRMTVIINTLSAQWKHTWIENTQWRSWTLTLLKQSEVI